MWCTPGTLAARSSASFFAAAGNEPERWTGLNLTHRASVSLGVQR
jgi:hypothetical protein